MHDTVFRWFSVRFYKGLVFDITRFLCILFNAALANRCYIAVLVASH